MLDIRSINEINDLIISIDAVKHVSLQLFFVHVT